MNPSRLLLLIVLLALPGLYQCAATSKAPSEQSDAAKSFDTLDDKGVVYLFRRGRAIEAATTVQVKINSLDAGGSGPGTFFRWELKPGKYAFAASTKESSAAVELDVEAGKLCFIEQIDRIGLSDLRVHLQIQDESTGKKAVPGLKLLVSSYVPE